MLSPATKLFFSTSTCWLAFLFLLIGNHHQHVSGSYSRVPGTSKCPYRHQLLRSAFKVQVDLEDSTPDASGMHQRQRVVCSTDEKHGLAELIEKAIQKASKKVAETPKFLLFGKSGASICKVPEEEETRRLSNQSPMSVRNLESHHRFRYYGGMRCNYCKRDNRDGVITYSKVGIRQCLKTWRTSPSLRMPVPRKAEGMKLEFDFHEIGGFQGQHIFVKINQKTVDLGEFYETLNEGKRNKNSDGFSWTMKPNPMGQRHNVSMALPKDVFLGKKYLDVNLSCENSDGDDQELSAGFGPEACLFFWYTKKGKRRLVSSPVSNPTTYSSPVSSPTMTYPSPTMANPVSSPIVAESFKIEEGNMMLNIESDVAKVDGLSGSESLIKLPSPRLSNSEGLDNNANTINSKRKTTTSNSNNQEFQKLVRDTLTSILNNDLKVVTSKPGHCMFGEEIKAVVHLTPKPEWEKNLPTCTGSNKSKLL